MFQAHTHITSQPAPRALPPAHTDETAYDQTTPTGTLLAATHALRCGNERVMWPFSITSFKFHSPREVI
jgi:hypothetical protein